MHLDPCASCIAGSAQARGDQPDESIAISVAHHAHPAPARARGAQPDESIAISLPTLRASCPRAGACDTRRSIVNHFTAWSRAARRTRSLCTEPTRAETILPQESHSARRASPHHFVRDARARHNDPGVQLRTHLSDVRSGDDGRCVRLLQRRVRRQARTIGRLKACAFTWQCRNARN
jgi:hypothetical protein